MTATRTYIGSTTHSGVSGSDTFTGASIGTAAANRKVVVGWCGIQSGAAALTPSMTIGGVSATLEASAQGTTDSNGNRVSFAIFSLDVPTGTTATIVVTFTGLTFFDSTIFVYAVNGAGAVLDFAAVSGQSISATAADVDVQTGGVVVGGMIAYNGTPGASWTGLTEDDDTTLYGVDSRAVASREISADETPRAISCDQNVSDTGLDSFAIVVVSYAASGAGGVVKRLNLPLLGLGR